MGQTYTGDRESGIKGLLAQLKLAYPPNAKPILAKLEAEAERLTTEIATLKFVSSAGPSKWRIMGFTATETSILELLERRAGPVSQEAIMGALYAHKPDCDYPDPEITKVRLSHIRSKLRRDNLPYWVETIWGVGYALRTGAEPELAKTVGGRPLHRSLATSTTAIQTRKYLASKRVNTA